MSLLFGSQTTMVQMGDGEPLCKLHFVFFWGGLLPLIVNQTIQVFDQGCTWSIITHSICMKLLKKLHLNSHNPFLKKKKNLLTVVLSLKS